ncbi:hypothetical protein IKG64_02055 [Candidatus Saccharibacteria bacterium]|nr:hypothetical protein [Candidatus Saccharibacteria bacterium]
MKRRTKRISTFLLMLMAMGAVVGGSVGVAELFGGEASALTYQSQVDMQFTFNPTVSINVTGDLIIPDLAPGSSSDSNIITVTAGSNDTHGYTLYSTVGSSTNNYTDLRITSSNTTNVFTNLSSNVTELSNFNDNTWGYSYCLTTNDCDTDNTYWVSGNSGSTANGYNGLPQYNASSNTTGVMLANTTTPSETELKFKIGAKASLNQIAGTYTNTINFIGVGKVVTTTYNLNYIDTTNEGTGLPSSLPSQTTNDGIVNISTTAPTRDGYVFKGWCDTNNSSDPTTCPGTTYEPGRIYIIPAASQGSGSTVNVNMYATWRSPAPSVLAMQDVTTWGSTLSTGDEITAVDTRDNKEYTVAKLADGNIWMTQNLDHDIVTDGSVTYDSTTTDVSSAWVPSNATTTTTTWDTSATGRTTPRSYDPGDLCWNGMLDENWGTTLSNGTTTCGDDKHYHIGNYYNWTAAVAMNDSSSYTTQNTDVNQSICPAGWRLPISGTTNTGSKSFQYLVNQLSLTSGTSGNIQNSPVYFVFGGYWGGSSYGVGSGGGYWSSVVYSSGGAYGLDFAVDGYLYPQSCLSRNYGYSVRCVAR